ncbi:MAG: alkaline phosphatase family protein [Acidimicrobiales bacterium]
MLLAVAMVAGGCGAGATPSASSTTPPRATTSSSVPPGTTASTAPGTTSAPHVMVIMMENKDYSEVIGAVGQPYTNSLATEYGLATASFGYTHPSLPNYLVMVSGSTHGVTDDGDPSEHRFAGAPTIADELAAAGVSTTAYAEDLPPNPTVSAGEYAVKHFPWEYFPATHVTVAPSSRLIADLQTSAAPSFVWYTPNLIDDEHDGTVEQGDAFLSHLIPEVQATHWYADGGRIVIEWDEADGDNSGVHGTDGGHVPTIVISAALRAHPMRVATPVDTAGVLGSIERLYGVKLLGASADAANGNIDSLITGG